MHKREQTYAEADKVDEFVEEEFERSLEFRRDDYNLCESILILSEFDDAAGGVEPCYVLRLQYGDAKMQIFMNEYKLRRHLEHLQAAVERINEQRGLSK